jgi:hypothetical protein
MKVLSILYTLFFFVSGAAAQNYQVCQKIIDKGLREYDIQTESEANLNSVFDNYCEQNGTRKTSSAGGSLDIVVKAIPIGLKGNADSSEEQVRNFCRSYSATIKSSRTANSYKETIATKAYDSFDKCVALVSKGVSIDHNVINRDTTSFFLQSGVNVPLEVRGLNAVNTTCIGPNPAGGAALTYGPTTKFTLKSDSIGFTCRRMTQQVAGGKTIYPEGSITITTNFQNYDVFLPRDERLPEDLASNLAAQISALQAKTNVELTHGSASTDGCQRINDLQVCWGTAILTPVLNKSCPCPIFSNEFQFAKGFSGTPAVSISAAGKTSGLTYVVYDHSVTEDKLSLSGHDTQYRDNYEPWVVTYIAFGKPK